MLKTKTLAFLSCLPLLLTVVAQGGSSSCSGAKSQPTAQQQRQPQRVNKNGATTGEQRRDEPKRNEQDDAKEKDETKDKGGAKGEGGEKEKARGDMKENIGGRVAEGTWGGDHIRVEVSAEGGVGAEVEYDCARGKISAPLDVDAEGRFDLSGTHVREGPGPIRVGITPPTRPARFAGRISGEEMTLTVTLTDTSQEIGVFNLRRGSEGRLRKCR